VACKIYYYRTEEAEMRSTITISIPDDLQKEIDKLSKEEGVSRSELVRESIRDYLFIRRFRSLRRSMTAKAGKRGVYTDQDVFDRVS
jgi:metal-responsive CopG/Arc/MetJ family transcriptional regulator